MLHQINENDDVLDLLNKIEVDLNNIYDGLGPTYVKEYQEMINKIRKYGGEMYEKGIQYAERNKSSEY